MTSLKFPVMESTLDDGLMDQWFAAQDRGDWKEMRRLGDLMGMPSQESTIAEQWKPEEDDVLPVFPAGELELLRDRQEVLEEAAKPEPDEEPEPVPDPPAERVAAPDAPHHIPGFYKQDKVLEAQVLFAAGKSTREITAETGLTQRTLIKIRKTVAIPDCGCGRPGGHDGWCKVRVERSQARQEFLKKFGEEHGFPVRSNKPRALRRRVRTGKGIESGVDRHTNPLQALDDRQAYEIVCRVIIRTDKYKFGMISKTGREFGFDGLQANAIFNQVKLIEIRAEAEEERLRKNQVNVAAAIGADLVPSIQSELPGESAGTSSW